MSTLNCSKSKWRKLARICTTYLNVNIWKLRKEGVGLRVSWTAMNARMDSLGYRAIPHLREELLNDYKLCKIISLLD